MVHRLWQRYPVTAGKLLRLEPYLLKAVSLPNPEIHNKIVELLKSGGKLLRPGYFFLFSEYGHDADPKALRAGAAALELLHVATLIHDDVIDESPKRRNVATIQTQYGDRNAIYAGDYLFTVYFDQVLKSTEDPAIMQEHINAMGNILTGELDQMALNYNVHATTEAYFEEITGKTAELFKLSCQQGVQLANGDQQTFELAGKIGKAIGTAYQILDDILDYSGDEDTVKKPVLEDVRAGVYSLPLLLAIQEDEAEFAELLGHHDAMTDDHMKQVAALVKQYDGVGKARAVAADYTQQALDLIAQLPSQRTTQNLASLTASLLQRNN